VLDDISITHLTFGRWVISSTPDPLRHIASNIIFYHKACAPRPPQSFLYLYYFCERNLKNILFKHLFLFYIYVINIGEDLIGCLLRNPKKDG
jgi:hypothetical protein